MLMSLSVSIGLQSRHESVLELACPIVPTYELHTDVKGAAHLQHVLLHCRLCLRLSLSMGCRLRLQVVSLRSLLKALGLSLEAVRLTDGLLLSGRAGLLLALNCQPRRMSLQSSQPS